jgi:hypothetical protein
MIIRFTPGIIKTFARVFFIAPLFVLEIARQGIAPKVVYAPRYGTGRGSDRVNFLEFTRLLPQAVP